MSSTHYCVSGSNEFKMKMLTGLSHLQQQEEFVDLTLAADGCIVKVHRNVVALASPYLREILKSIPNHHPVLFLNNVSQTTLSYLLEFIYQGEVKIPKDLVKEFIELSKSLHIAGIDSLELPKEMAVNKKQTQNSCIPNLRVNEKSGHITIDSNNSGKVDNLGNSCGTNITTNQLESVQHIVDNNHITPNLDLNMDTNSPLISFKSNTQENVNDDYDSNHQQIQAEKNNQMTENTTDMPTINITDKITQEMNTAQPNYNLIIKTNNQKATESSQNIPVIEIQHLKLTGQQDSNMIDDEALPTQTDILQQAIHKNLLPILEPIQDNNKTAKSVLIINNKVLKPVLDSLILNVTPLEGNVETDALPLNHSVNMNAMKNMAQYSLTERGAVQLILNRFVYCCHHSSRSKLRWRCIDYRRQGCPAFIDTVRGVIVARKGLHAHSFHDNKVHKMQISGLIYPTMELAKAAGVAKQMIKTTYETGDDDTEC